MTPTQKFLVYSWYARALVIANRMSLSNELSREDAVGEALYALTKSAYDWPAYCERNDIDITDMGVFGHYVNRCVTGRILEVIRSNSPLTKKYYKIYTSIQDAYAKGASHKEMAKLSNSSIQDVSQVISVMYTRTESIESFSDVGDIEEFSDDSLASEVTSAMARLTEEEASVVEFRVLDGMSFLEIGSELGMSKKRAQDVYALAIARLRTMLREESSDE